MVTGNKHNLVNVDALHKYHTGVNTPSVSDELINENVTSFKPGTSNVTGVDLTNQMEQSIVTLNGIEGKTEVINNIIDPTQRIKNTQIKLLYTLDEKDTTNYFNNKNITSSFGDTTCTLDGNNIRVTTSSNGWRCVDVEVYGLEPGCVYRLGVDEVVVRSGGTAISVDSKMNSHLLSNVFANHSTRPNFNSNGLVLKAKNNKLKFYFYVNLGEDSQGDVSYNGITLRKVKEYTCADLTLRSLPNGVKDEIKNNKFIKRIISYTLNGTESWIFADGSKPRTNSFSCPLPNAVPVDKMKISLNSNKYKMATDEEVYLQDIVGLAIGGASSKELVFRVDKGIDSVDRLKSHLSQNEKDITIEYEIEEEVYDINLSVTCPPGETIFIDTNDNLTFSHQVQLNTKAQVEEIQNETQQIKKSIWQKIKELTTKIKELTDVEMKLENNGYIKLPTAFGGLILQWGSFHVTGANNINWFGQNVTFPKPMSEVFTIQCSVDSLGTWDATRGVKALIERESTNTTGTKFIIYSPDDTSTTLRWFVIGR